MRVTYGGLGRQPGTGAFRIVLGTTPGAGAQIAETVPAGKVWRLVSFHFNLLCSATVASRLVAIKIDDGAGNNVTNTGSGKVQTASQGIDYVAANNGVLGDTSNAIILEDFSIPLPAMIYLLTGWRILSSTANMQAADAFTLVRYMVEEWVA